jgi:hypothetical protein
MELHQSLKHRRAEAAGFYVHIPNNKQYICSHVTLALYSYNPFSVSTTKIINCTRLLLLSMQVFLIKQRIEIN